MGWARWAEFVALFVLVPTWIAWQGSSLPLLPLLWIGAGGCTLALLRSPRFDRRSFGWFDAGSVRSSLAPIAARFLVFAPCVLLYALWAHPDSLWSLPRARPLLWALVMLLYPVLSVYPQGIVYRGFLFDRYRRLVPSDRGLVLLGAAAFAWTHIVFRNAVAPPLAFLGGLLFARTYLRTDSLLLAAIEHALYGCLLFTVGLGRFFYHG